MSMKKLISFMIVTVLIIGSSFAFGLAVKEKDGYDLLEEMLETSQKEMTSLQISTYNESAKTQSNYYKTKQGWTKLGIIDGKDVHTILPSSLLGEGIELSEENYGYGTEVVKVTTGAEAEFNISIMNAGLYALYLDYYIVPGTATAPSVGVRINDEVQFTACYLLTLWAMESEKRYDRYKDELTPKMNLSGC